MEVEPVSPNDNNDNTNNSSNSKPQSEENKIEDLRNPNVVTKHRLAGDIVNQALQLVVNQARPGRRIVELCQLADDFIVNATGKIFNNTKGQQPIEKGIAFPCCISVNHIIGHFSPLSSDTAVLKENDVVKIDLGAHIDGYSSVGAHTFILTNKYPVEGKRADVVTAANVAAECALRLLKPGNKNTQITDMFGKVAEQYKCVPVFAVISHQIQRFSVDGDKAIISREDNLNEVKVNECEFETNEVYFMDIVMSTGEGRPHRPDERTTVYRRVNEGQYQLKMKTSRALYSDIHKRFPHFPFTVRALEDEKKARMGIIECANHGLLEPYPVLHEKQGELVAHVKFTALLLPNGTIKITGLPTNPAHLRSQYQINDAAIKSILAQSAKPKNKKPKKKKKKAVDKGKQQVKDVEIAEDDGNGNEDDGDDADDADDMEL